MSIVVFADIDDTLIQAKNPHPSNAALDNHHFAGGRKSSSFATVQQQKLIALFAAHEFIPVTGRSAAALERLDITFSGFKVVDHGAIILDQHNQVLKGWQVLLDEYSQPWGALLQRFNTDINALIKKNKLPLRCRLISDFDIPCYLSVKGEPDAMAALEELGTAFCQSAAHARVHRNGSNMAFLPPYACKKAAVEFLKKQYLAQDEDTLFLGVGDSHSDLPYMQSCHFLMMPATSQIDKEKLA